MKAFIPAWLDDKGLSPAEFRVYCHLCRRADNDTQIAWPSYVEMIGYTGMGKSTIRRAIEHLEKLELIQKIKKPFGDSCRYLIIPIVPPRGQMNDSNSSTTQTIAGAPIVSPQDSNSSISDPPIVPPEGQEGNPLKAIQLRKSNTSNKNSRHEPSFEQIDFSKWFKELLPQDQQDRLPKSWLMDWCETYNKLVKIDKRDPEKIREVCKWARTNPFWSSNFGSPSKLRKRNSDGIFYFDVFAEKMKSTASKINQTAVDTSNRPATYEEL